MDGFFNIVMHISTYVCKLTAWVWSVDEAYIGRSDLCYELCLVEMKQGEGYKGQGRDKEKETGSGDRSG